MTVIVRAQEDEVLHLRTRLRFPNFNLYSAPHVFDQAKPFGARIKRSTTRFDRGFGGKRETRRPNDGLVHHVMAQAPNDNLIQEQFGTQGDALIGLCQFLWALGHADSPEGSNFLPQLDGRGEIRLLAYIRDQDGRPQATEALRVPDGFLLDAFDLSEVVAWDGRTFLLTLTNPNI